MVVAGTIDEALERLEVVLQTLTKTGFSFCLYFWLSQNITTVSFDVSFAFRT